jgi:hypothetical protein
MAGSRIRLAVAASPAAVGVIAAVALGALTASASGSGRVIGSPNRPVPSHRGSANRRLARLDAARALSRLRLPAGATRSATEPAGDRGELARPAARQLGNMVDWHQWWVLPRSAADVDAFLRTHPPVGARLTFSAETVPKEEPPSQLVEGFTWPAVRGRLSTRQLLVAVAPLGDGASGVRVDAQAVWITPRAAAEPIPRRATRLEVELRHGPQVVAGPFTFTARRRVARVRSLINSLPAAQPGPQSCPNEAGYDVRLTFISSRAATLALVNADPQGCEGVELTLGDRRRTSLTSEGFPGSGRSPRRPLIGQLDAALGLRLGRKVGVSVPSP